MNRFKIKLKTVAALVLAFAIRNTDAAGAFVADDFERFTAGVSVNGLSNWWASSTDVVVTNSYSPAHDGPGTNAVYLPVNTSVSNGVGQVATNIWTECWLYETNRMILETVPPAFANTTYMMGISTGGYALVYDPGVTNWVEITQDVWGSNVVVGATNWAQVSVFQNYTNHTVSLFLNGHLLTNGLPFITNLNTYGSFQLDSGSDTNALLDNVYVSNAIPPSLTNVDLDHDGLADALEVQQYGNVATWRRLTNTVSATGSGTINPTGTFTVISGSNVAYTLTSAEAWIVGGLTNTIVDVLPSLNSTGFRSWAYTNNNVTADRVIHAEFVRDGIHYVPGDHTTITGALAVALAWTNDQIVVSNGVYAETLVLSNGVMLVGTNMTGPGDTNLTINGSVTVITGMVSTVSGALTVTGQVTIAAGGLLTISNTATSFGGLATGAGGKVQVVGGSLAIGSITNGPGTYWMVTNRVTSAGNGTITPSGTNTMVSTWQDVTYALTGAEAYVVAALTNNGVVTLFDNTKTATYTNFASNITNDQMITAAFIRDGIHYVPGDHTTITGALAVALAWTNDQIVVSNGVYAETLVLSNGVMLVGTNMTGAAGDTNLTINGSVTVITGMVSTVSGALTVTGQVNVASGGLLTISNTVATFGGLTFADSVGQVHVVDGEVTVNGITLSGTFWLNTNSFLFAKSTLNFTDDFENYAANTALRSLGRYGWAATDPGAVVQVAVTNLDAHAALIPAAVSVSNSVSTSVTYTRVWTDLYLKDTSQMTLETAPDTVDTTSAVQLYFGTNGWLTLYNRQMPGWVVCSNDVVGGPVPTVGTGDWARVSVFLDFNSSKASIFLNRTLLRQEIPFVSATSIATYHDLSLAGGQGGAAYFDSVKIWTNTPTGLATGPASDLDYDGIPDAREIELYGNLTTLPRGSVFKIR
jgi:hypothetical protein